MCLLFLVFFVVSDDFLNDEVQEFLGKLGVQIGLGCKGFEPSDLRGLTGRITGRQVVSGLEAPHSLRVFEPLAQRVDEDGIEPVDAAAVLCKHFGGAGYDVISQEQSLSV